MSKMQEIKSAIRHLSKQERQELAERLALLSSEFECDLIWKQIIRDPRPRPALSALGDQIEAEFRRARHQA